LLPGANAKMLVKGKPGAGKTTTLVKLLEAGKWERIVLIKPSFRPEHIDRLLAEEPGKNWVLIWDDLQWQKDLDIFKQTIERFKDKFKDFACLAAIRSTDEEKLKEIHNQFRERFPLENLNLSDLSKEQLLKLIAYGAEDFKVTIAPAVREKLAAKAAKCDPTPFYIVSVLAPRKGEELTEAQVAEIPAQAREIWEGYYERLPVEEQRLLMGLKMLRLLSFPPIKPLVKDLFCKFPAWRTGSASAAQDEFTRVLKSLIKKEWVRKEEEYCPAYDLQLEAVDLEPEVWGGWEQFLLQSAYSDRTKGILARLIADYLSKQQKYSQCSAYYRLAIKYNPNDPVVWTNLGAAQGDLGQLETAVKSHQKALAINPDLAEAWSNLGLAQAQFGQLETAMKSYLKALEIKPNFPEAWYNLGATQAQLGQPEAAVKSYLQALAIEPDCLEAWVGLGLTQVELGQVDAAMKSCQKALAINSDCPEAWYSLGAVQTELGQLDTAVKSYQKVLAIKPDFTGAWVGLGLAWFQLNNPSNAGECWRKAQKLAKKQNNKALLAAITELLEQLEFQSPPSPSEQNQ